MLTKNTIKRIVSLQVKKFRKEHGVFIAEGSRLIDELFGSNLEIKELYYTSQWKSNNIRKAAHSEMVSEDEMKKISALSTPSQVLAVVEIPEYKLDEIDFTNELVLALDTIQDPGNLGTIVRLADWFGINSIICSRETVDIFSPKVIQSTMGAITRVRVIFCNLTEELTKIKSKVPIYGTFMEGSNIYRTELKPKGVVVMGNEGNGISPEIEKLVSQKIHIPSFAKDRTNVESLNVAMATAIVFSEFRRR
ncbi:RNA methyltransferase [Tenuifilaceae bacterium CYCD]|nr:RNA methyltransferase [Tenuifilaceae bacterium CYCD]